MEFERYADDAVVHCVTERQARAVWAALADRMDQVGLWLHPDKTKIVYWKDDNRRGSSEHTSFTFLGYVGRSGAGPGTWARVSATVTVPWWTWPAKVTLSPTLTGRLGMAGQKQELLRHQGNHVIMGHEQRPPGVPLVPGSRLA